MNEIKLGFYEHFKGKNYEVIGTCIDSETCERKVLYKACYDDPIYAKNCLWTRNTKEFQEEIEINGEKTPRFKFIGETLEEALKNINTETL